MGILTGKKCMITGANSGIGKALSLALAGHGASITMVCRNKERGEAAKNSIIENTKNPDVNLLIIDLLSRQSIRDGVEEFKKTNNKLDILINNAGAIFFKKTMSSDGVESTYALNTLAPFFLTNLLLDILKSSSPSRIVNVVSEGTSKKIDIDDMVDPVKYNAASAYSTSKQAEILFTYDLAQRLKGTGVTANCFYPGLVRTNLGKVDKGIFKLTFKIMTLLLKPMFTPIDESIKIGLFLAASKKAEGMTGAYLKKEKDKVIVNRKYDIELAKKIREKSAELTGV